MTGWVTSLVPLIPTQGLLTSSFIPSGLAGALDADMCGVTHRRYGASVFPGALILG